MLLALIIDPLHIYHLHDDEGDAVQSIDQEDGRMEKELLCVPN